MKVGRDTLEKCCGGELQIYIGISVCGPDADSAIFVNDESERFEKLPSSVSGKILRKLFKNKE